MAENMAAEPSKRVYKGRTSPTLLQERLDIPRRPCWYNVDMIEARCPQCRAYYCGWALLNPRHQTCSKCGTALEITEDGRPVARGYSPFTAEKLFLKPTTDAPSTTDKEKDKSKQKK
jgi:hypothetical protein